MTVKVKSDAMADKSPNLSGLNIHLLLTYVIIQCGCSWPGSFPGQLSSRHEEGPTICAGGSHGCPRSSARRKGKGNWGCTWGVILGWPGSGAHPFWSVTGELSHLKEGLGNGVTTVFTGCCCVTNHLKTYGLKITMNICYSTVSMGQGFRRIYLDGSVPLLCIDGVCVWLLEFLQPFCHHEGSHLER